MSVHQKKKIIIIGRRLVDSTIYFTLTIYCRTSNSGMHLDVYVNINSSITFQVALF